MHDRILTSLALFLARGFSLLGTWEWWFSSDGSSERDGEMEGEEKGGDTSSKPASLRAEINK